MARERMAVRLWLCRAVATLAFLMATAQGATKGSAAQPGDWPQWRGPERTGISQETGLLKSWPEGGPALAWKAKGLGGGFSSVAVAAGRVYTQGHVKGQEMVFALDEATGQLAWSKSISPAGRVGPAGSRSTPTVSGGRLYVESVMGNVACLEAADGREVWRVSLVQDFGGTVPQWGYSESPLVDGDRVVCTPGRANAMVALDKATGKAAWEAALPYTEAANYSSPVVAELGGKRQYIQFIQKGAIGVEASSGQFLWFGKFGTPDPGYSCNTPLVTNELVFLSSQWSGIALRSPASGAAAEKAYETRDLRNVHSGYVAVGDHLYGGQTRSSFACVGIKTGRLAWQDPRPGMCAVIAADGLLFLRNEKGPLLLAEASPAGYKETGRFDPPDRTREPAWAHPALANGRLYIRDQDVLLCFDVRAKR